MNHVPFTPGLPKIHFEPGPPTAFFALEDKQHTSSKPMKPKNKSVVALMMPVLQTKPRLQGQYMRIHEGMDTLGDFVLQFMVLSATWIVVVHFR